MPRLSDIASDNENYLCLNDILASHEKVPCKFEMPVLRLGFLDTGTDVADIRPGAKLELPYWLARALCNRRRSIVSVELPKQYRAGYREILEADASVVDLHKLGPFYYAFGMKLLNFELPESRDIATSLLQTFVTRFRGIMDSSQNALDADMAALVARLDDHERALFALGQRGLRAQQRWETRQTDRITVSDMVLTHRKRKRTEMETS
ncbi:PREDICTED: DNA replication complex GINS protein PSF3-like [Priapulus caudatus]|uniref:DNA replication complex GINS protein PSF3 n=1 Tax=Priapulus caudatus TaxID=37621 RepID=A0ABM1EG55_PRICU|nr:PREDICTED: DNA replication complex GINS protein PSF3-like [Priapulus caudatus]